MAHLMGERLVTQTRVVARAMRGASASTIWLQRARGTLLVWPKHARAERSYGCVLKKATQDPRSA